MLINFGDIFGDDGEKLSRTLRACDCNLKFESVFEGNLILVLATD